MEQDLREYLDNQISLFAEQGWKDFIEKVKEIREQAENPRNYKTVEEFHIAKGQLDILDWLVKWEDLVRLSYEENEQTSSF